MPSGKGESKNEVTAKLARSSLTGRRGLEVKEKKWLGRAGSGCRGRYVHTYMYKVGACTVSRCSARAAPSWMGLGKPGTGRCSGARRKSRTRKSLRPLRCALVGAALALSLWRRSDVEHHSVWLFPSLSQGPRVLAAPSNRPPSPHTPVLPKRVAGSSHINLPILVAFSQMIKHNSTRPDPIDDEPPKNPAESEPHSQLTTRSLFLEQFSAVDHDLIKSEDPDSRPWSANYIRIGPSRADRE